MKKILAAASLTMATVALSATGAHAAPYDSGSINCGTKVTAVDSFTVGHTYVTMPGETAVYRGTSSLYVDRTTFEASDGGSDWTVTAGDVAVNGTSARCTGSYF